MGGNLSNESNNNVKKGIGLFDLSKSSSFHKKGEIFTSLSNKTNLNNFIKNRGDTLHKMKLRTTADETKL
jgi:hypothetical protein